MVDQMHVQCTMGWGAFQLSLSNLCTCTCSNDILYSFVEFLIYFQPSNILYMQFNSL